MVTLTADTTHEWEAYAAQHDANLIVASGETIYAGQYVQYDGTVAESIRNIQDDATAEFAGVALTGGTAGVRINVRQVGLLRVTLADAVTIGAEGTAVYADADGTANNNPEDTTTASTNNLPVGTVVRVTDDATDAVVILIQAEGFNGR